MKFDIFLSICQTDVNGYLPDEQTMFSNFFDQVKLADELGYGVAWVAETHLSCEVQKTGPQPVIPHFKGEIGLNTDILQMAHKIFSMTKNIEVGSAIRNILCNGGPIAHAEAIRTFLALHGLNPEEKRRLHLGFASGRFEFSNRPYGIVPRDEVEEAAWPVVKGKVLMEATEIFLRLIRGERLSSDDLPAQSMKPEDFRAPEDWEKARAAYAKHQGLVEGDSEQITEIPLKARWTFEKLGVIPKEVRQDLLNLVIGTHDPKIQKRANELLPVAVFNLSITPPKVIDETHERMQKEYHPEGGPWQRSYMPRTAMVFIDNSEGLSPEEQSKRAEQKARAAWENYWKALQGTIDNEKVEKAVHNALVGNPAEVARQIREKYHPDDRLMLWFDFNNHDNEAVKEEMRIFMNEVAPQLNESWKYGD